MTDERVYGICLECGHSHAPPNRRRLIRPMADQGTPEIRAAWPCFYPPGVVAERRLFRDLAAIRRTTTTQIGEHV